MHRPVLALTVATVMGSVIAECSCFERLVSWKERLLVFYPTGQGQKRIKRKQRRNDMVSLMRSSKMATNLLQCQNLPHIHPSSADGGSINT